MGSSDDKWRLKAEDLLAAARDVRRGGVPLHPPGAGAAPHRDLFERYVVALRRAKEWADNWWESLVETECGRTPDRATAERLVATRNPLGRVGHMRVVAVVREYWLACEVLNGEAPGQAVAPEDLLLRWLMEPPHQELAAFLSALPYWPVGLDDSGRWV